MFFRNVTLKAPTFEERIANLKQFGFLSAPESGGRCRVTRDGCGAVIEDLGGGKVAIGKPGLLMGNEIAELVNAGYQMFLRAPSGRETPALASHLKTLHAFDEDLGEGLGLTSLYNLSLGTTSDAHMYDRVTDRDQGPHSHPWDK